MNVIEAAKAAGGTVMHPHDYGASPDRMILSFDSLDCFAKIIRNQALEEAKVTCAGIGAGYTGAARRLRGVQATLAAGMRDGANECAAEIRAMKEKT